MPTHLLHGQDPFVALLVAFAVAAALTPIVARLARVVGAVDRPSGRGLALGGTPLLGGVAMVVAVGFAVQPSLGSLPAALSDELRWIMLGAVAIVVVGVVDDRFDLHWSAKLLGQIGAALIPATNGIVVGNVTIPGLGAVEFHGLSTPLTVLGFVAIMNVVNLSDGVDGLAAGVCSIAAIALGIIAWDLNRDHASILAAATCGAALGFLVHNFHPARVFMGDAGALLLGYLLAAVSVEGSVKTGAVLALVVPLVVLALPFLDTTFVVLKRLKMRQPVFGADQNHFHHRLTRIGFSPRRTVLYLYAWAAALASLAVAARYVPYNDNEGHFYAGWTIVMVVLFLAVLALSVYLVIVLEIVKLRRLDARRLRRQRPGVTEREIDDDVDLVLATGEFQAITGESDAVGSDEPLPR